LSHINKRREASVTPGSQKLTPPSSVLHVAGAKMPRRNAKLRPQREIVEKFCEADFRELH